MAINVLLLVRLDSLLEEVSSLRKVIAEQTLQELTEEPKCPACGSGVLRPKCMLASDDCPRHLIVQELGGHDRLWTRVREVTKVKFIQDLDGRKK
jgi:hypothetical protein